MGTSCPHPDSEQGHLNIVQALEIFPGPFPPQLKLETAIKHRAA